MIRPETRRRLGLGLMIAGGGSFGGIVGAAAQAVLTGGSVPIRVLLWATIGSALLWVYGRAAWDEAWRQLARTRRSSEADR